MKCQSKQMNFIFSSKILPDIAPTKNFKELRMDGQDFNCLNEQSLLFVRGQSIIFSKDESSFCIPEG